MKLPENYLEDEVRCGFYVPGMLKRAWAAQLVMLEKLRDFCRDYHIQWFASYGTLLGAVRHKGFIPWDDDVDVWMKRKDYETFLRNVNMMPDSITFMEGRYGMEDNTMFDQPFGRIVNTERYMPEAEFLNEYGGYPYPAGIDIFVLDNIASDEFEEQLRKESGQYILYAIQLLDDKDANKDELEECISNIEKWSNIHIDRDGNLFQQLMHIFEGVCCLYNEQDSGKIASMSSWIPNGNALFDAEWFESSIEFPFEYITLPVPVGYDQVLTKVYGNYMTPYQGSSHNFPLYRDTERAIEELGDSGLRLPYNYYFDKAALKRPEKPVRKKYIRSYLQLLLRACFEAIQGIGTSDLKQISENLGTTQDLAMQLQKLLVQNYADVSMRTAGLLQELYQKLFSLYQTVQKQDVSKQARLIQETQAIVQQVQQKIQEEIIRPVEVLFLPFKSCGWERLQPLYDYFRRQPGVRTYVMPIPWYRRNEVFEFPDVPIYEGKEISEKVDIIPLNDMFLPVHTPDIVITQNAYDQYGIGFTVSPQYYTEKILTYAGELVYTPWFDIDDVLPEHQGAWSVAYSYTDMPGVVRADKVIVPSYSMRYSYIEHLTEFAGSDTWKHWDQTVLVAKTEEDCDQIFHLNKETGEKEPDE